MAERLRRSRPTGTTLVELMVSATLFLLLMGAIMSFYNSGAKVTSQQDQRMETLRRSLRILDRMEVLLKNSRIIGLSSTENTPDNQTIIFTPLSKTKTLQGQGSPWEVSASRIYVKGSNSQSEGSGAGTGTKTGTGTSSAPGAEGSSSESQGAEIFYCDGQGTNRLIGTLYPGESLNMSAGTGVIKITLKLNYYQNQKNISENQQYKQERTIPLYNYVNY